MVLQFSRDVSRPVAENDTVILMINNKGGFTAKVERGKTIKICKDTFHLESLIGTSYGDVFTKEHGEWIKIRHGDPQYRQYRSRIMETYADKQNALCTDNRDIIDDNTSQKLSYVDIQQLKKDCMAHEVIETIVDNSETFAKKNKMAQEKYIRRKESRHVKLFYVRPCDLYNICDCYFNSFPHKIGYLNFSNLGMMLHLANITYNNRVMVLDHALGLITGAVSQRLAGSGKIYRLVSKGVSDKIVHELGIQYFDNIFSIDMSRYITMNINAVATKETLDPQNGDPNPTISEAYTTCPSKDTNGNDKSNNSKGPVAIPDNSDPMSDESAKRLEPADVSEEQSSEQRDTKKQKVNHIHGIYPLYNIPKEDICCQVIIGNIAFNKCDQLNSLVSAYTEAMKLAADMYLEMGGRLVIFGQQYQPMAELQAMLTRSDEYVNVKFDEIFCREYQMLPLRTHPVMTTELRPCCGFIVSATKTSRDILP
ncbi:tRNAadenine(58)-N(1)-methyltransferase non-catalytic subunit trm6 [Babesia ovis]|uniref:tRNA (adenine(58)-N(1))-methyltransferase non-catalytic subunit TRM6 n=1 Tax=Babesia ovis TaxID=5869 RepID=A0A9W5TAY4_BABOV|nr:tRNAadenine(58)-N(1)-methyltransferase non-catalytic subunit trm6 [Babesia ovis]